MQCNNNDSSNKEEVIEGPEYIIDVDFREEQADTVNSIQDLDSENNERGLEERKEDLEDEVDKDSIDS